MKFSKTIAVFTLIFSTFAFANEFIPNDLSKVFKFAGKLPHKDLPLGNHLFSGVLDPSSHQPILLLDILPSDINDANLGKFVADQFGASFNVKHESVLPKGDFYSVFFKNEKIEDAWVKVQCKLQEAEKKCVAAFRMPAPLTEPARFQSSEILSSQGLMLVGKSVTEFNTEAISQTTRRIHFPLDSSFAPKTVVRITAETKSRGVLEKFELPQGTFPDCIRVDANDRVWFTQPSDNLLSLFDPVARTWTHKTVGSLPDGLWMDRAGALWFGEYGGNAIGYYDPKTDKYIQYPAPYTPSAPAIPYEDQDGLIWTTDHAYNSIIKLDPVSGKSEAFEIPQSGVWPVEITQIDDLDYIWITQAYGNTLGRLKRDLSHYESVDMLTSDIPAFFETHGDSIWVSLWTKGFTEYNVKTKSVTEYELEDVAQPCHGIGPISVSASGKVFLGCLANNRVYRFDPETRLLDWAEGSGSLKDGSAIDSQDRFWTTDMGAIITRTTF